MSETLYAYDGLDELEKKLANEIEVRFPNEFKRIVYDIATELQEQVIERTPVKTSNLQNNWKIGDIVINSKESYIEVYNNVEYVLPVEEGHRIKNSDKVVAGYHMMQISLAVIEARLPDYLRDWMSDLLERLDF